MAHGIKTTETNDGSIAVPVLSNFPIGLAGIAASATGLDAGESVVVRSPDDVAALALGAGTLLPALEAIYSVAKPTVVVHRVAAGVDDAATKTALAGSSVSRTGVWSFLRAEALYGVKPKIICVPDHSSGAVVYAPMVQVANRLLGRAVLDGPDTNAAAAIAMADAVSDADGRAYLIDPRVIFGGEEQPASPFVAAVLASIEYWQSPSSKLLPVEGTSRPIEFAWGDDDCEAAALNAGKVATIVRDAGWKIWGVRGLGTNPMTLQLNQRATADVINESIAKAHRYFVDKGIVKNLINAVVNSVNAFLRVERTRGAVAGGFCWPNPDLNTAESLAEGKLWIDYDFTPTPVLEDLRFTQRLTGRYLSNLLTS